MSKKAAFPEYVAKSLADYASHTMSIRQSWETKRRTIDPWFRGHSNVSHALLPGWYRLRKRAKGIDEDDLLEEFQRRAVPFLEGQRPDSFWEWYFVMQHHGLPTRLLDWSESSLVGLFFAVGDWNGRGGNVAHDAVVWMLDPWYLNKWSTGKDEVFRYDDPRIAKYLPKKLYSPDRSPDKPVALVPLHNSRRLTAQRGVFTVHGADETSLEKMLSAEKQPHLAKITIPKKHVLDVRVELQLTGVSDVTLFPEMPYLCQDILRNWDLVGAPVES